MTNLSSTVQVVDPAQAKLWLERKYKHQRNVDQQHVRNLARAMSDGTFGISHITFAAINGDYHLINGQHTLHAIVLSGKPQTLPVNYVQVENEEQEAELYYRTDRGRQRSLSDSLRVTNLVGRLNLTETQINRVASALRFAKTGFKSTRSRLVSDDDLVEWLPNWVWECRQVYRVMEGAKTDERDAILRQAVFPVALITMRYQPEKARAFWEGVAKDDGLGRKDPRKTLHNWLHDIKGQNARMGKRVHSNAIARGAAIAWNMFFPGEGKGLNYINVEDPNAKIVILGTDYTGIQSDDFLPLWEVKHKEEKDAKEEKG